MHEVLILCRHIRYSESLSSLTMDVNEPDAVDAQQNLELETSEPPESIHDGDEGEEIMVEPVEEGPPEDQEGAIPEQDMDEEWFDYEDDGAGDSLEEGEGDMSLFDSDEGEHGL